MFNEYFKEELQIMPIYLKKMYMRSIKGLVNEKKYENSKDAIEGLFNSGIPIDDLIENILDNHNELLKDAYLNIENGKSMKYSALFELVEDRTIDELIDFISESNTLDESVIDMSNPNREIKAIKLNENTIKFTFLLQGIRISSRTPISCKTTYSVIVKFWSFTDIERKFIEISTDNVATYFRYEQQNFFENIINIVSDFLEIVKLLPLEPLDLFETLESIKEKEKMGHLKNLPKASAQKMLLSSGSQAILDSNDAESIILPILGELKQLIELNVLLFSKNNDTKEIRELLEGFISDTELQSDLPWITFTWDNKIKSKKIQVKFILSEYPYTMLSYYGHSKQRGGMNDVVESLLKEYSECRDGAEKENSEESNDGISQQVG